ncbi:MAG: acetate--CoA ligase [Aureispira sp.]
MTKRITSLEDYQQTYQQSVQDPTTFWAEQAATFTWQQPWKKVSTGTLAQGNVRWFEDGQLNITENCLDRHLATKGEQLALIWEPSTSEQEAISYTYQQLQDKVCQVANALKKLGVKKGDIVCLYMPMVVELPIAMLACARIGAIHMVVFAGLSAQALKEQLVTVQARWIMTTDGQTNGPSSTSLNAVVEEALAEGDTLIQQVWVYEKEAALISLQEGRMVIRAEALKEQKTTCPATPMDANDALFILYTSGATGAPKGVVHHCGGYMVYTAYSFQNVFQQEEGEVHWCTANLGWITGHSYALYGPLLTGATTLLFEGTPTHPTASRSWQICEKYHVNQFYTTPNTIRALQAYGEKPVVGYDLSSLKVLGTVGELIDEEAWYWYDEVIGQEQCPIVDTWWQTETGGIMLSALAQKTPSKACFTGWPLPGIQPCLLNAAGEELEGAAKGFLCIKEAWPSMFQGLYGAQPQDYLEQFEGYYYTGDLAERDQEGYYRILGRVEDRMEVAGQYLETAIIEEAINGHLQIIESAVVAYAHPTRGQGIGAYLVTMEENADPESLAQEIGYIVHKNIGKFAKPDRIQIVPNLPKNRAGKIERQLLRKIASGATENLGDTSRLLDPTLLSFLLNKA